jgi:hypothetical protein
MMIDTKLLLEKIDVKTMAELLELIDFTNLQDKKEKEKVIEVAMGQIQGYLKDEHNALKLFLSFFIILFFNVEFERYSLVREIYEEAIKRTENLRGMSNNIIRILDYFDESKKKKENLDPQLKLLIDSIESHKKIIMLQKMKDV